MSNNLGSLSRSFNVRTLRTALSPSDAHLIGRAVINNVSLRGRDYAVVSSDYWTAVQQQDVCEMTLEYFDQVSQNDRTLINILSVFYVRKYYQMSDNLGSVSRSFDLQMHSIYSKQLGHRRCG